MGGRSNRRRGALGKITLLLLLLSANIAIADDRCCVDPKRDSNGKIIRSKAVINEFIRLYPLPSHLKREDFQINHAIPLACGGKDIIENLLWMHKKAKTCADDWCQDRHERATMCPKRS